jgi:hypothetical protein
VQTRFAISDRTAEAAGFPPPEEGRRVFAHGRVWTWHENADTGMGELGAWLSTLIGTGGSIGGSLIGKLIGGAAGGPIGAGIGLLSSLIAGIFGAHAAKVAQEDQISGAWASSGPAAINAVMSAYHSGQVSASDASTALDQIEAQFRSMAQPIAKLKGQFGAFPDPTGPRPSSDCNWACGTSWDLHQQLTGLKSQLAASSGGGIGGLNLGALTGDPIVLGGLAVIAFLLMGGGKGRR